MGFESEKCQIFWIFTNLRTKVLNMKKTWVLVLLSGLFDRSRSRTVTALAFSLLLASLFLAKKAIGVASSCLQKNSAAFWVLILYLRVSFWLEKGSRVRGSEATGQRKKKNYYEQTKTTIIMKKIFNESGR